MHRGPRDFPAGSNPRVIRVAELGFVPRCAEIHGFSDGSCSVSGAPRKLMVVPAPLSCTKKGASLSLGQLRGPFAFHLYLYDLVMSLLGAPWIEKHYDRAEHFPDSGKRSSELPCNADWSR